jgi:hypothetical protein
MTKSEKKLQMEKQMKLDRERDLITRATKYPQDLNGILLVADKWLNSYDVIVVPMTQYKDTVIEVTLQATKFRNYTSKIRFPLYIFPDEPLDEIENKLNRFYDAQSEIRDYVQYKKDEAEKQERINSTINKLTKEECILLKEYWSK